MFDYESDRLFSYTVNLDSPEVIGPVPEGIRANFYVASGEISGPKLFGKLHPIGGDWLTLRTDGLGILDVRATFETQDEALIYVTYTDVGDLGEDGYKRFLRGELPSTVPLRVVPRFQTANPDYQWLNRLQCVGIGEVNLESLGVSYDV